MKQYLITAYDFTDTGALARRMNIRPNHLNGVKDLQANNNYIVGGAILSDEGNMIGSVMILQFETAEALKNWQQNEPYITQKIWESVEIKPFKVAEVK